MAPAYDERKIRERLERLPNTRQVAFAAACAEWLYGCYEEFASATGQGVPLALRAVIDTAWTLSKSEALPRDGVERMQALAESLVPNDHGEDWSELSPLAQNSAASAAYALRTWLLQDCQEAVWAARQLYEAGDFLLQVGAADVYAATAGSDGPFALVVNGVAAALENSSNGNVEAVRAEAMRGGLELRALLVCEAT